MKIQYILLPFLGKIRGFYDIAVQESTSSPSQQEYIGNFTLF